MNESCLTTPQAQEGHIRVKNTEILEMQESKVGIANVENQEKEEGTGSN